MAMFLWPWSPYHDHQPNKHLLVFCNYTLQVSDLMGISSLELKRDQPNYSMGLVVDIDLGHSTLCLGLLGQMGLWLNWLCNWAKWCNI